METQLRIHDRDEVIDEGGAGSAGLLLRGAPLESLFDLGLGAQLCAYPAAGWNSDEEQTCNEGASEDGRAGRCNGRPPEELLLETFKRLVTGFVDPTLASRGGDICRSQWSLSYGNIQRLDRWQQTPPSVLTSSNVGTLNILHLAAATVARRGIPGDFIELGVFRGGGSAFLKALIDAYGHVHGSGARQRRDLWLVDTFSGIPKPTEADLKANPDDPTHTWPHHSYNASKQAVVDTLRRLGVYDDDDDNGGSAGVHILEGAFDDVLPGLKSLLLPPQPRLALVRIDADTYAGTLSALRHTYPLVSQGGIIIIDDFHLAGAWKAVHDFLKETTVDEQHISVRKGGQRRRPVVLPVPLDRIRGCSLNRNARLELVDNLQRGEKGPPHYCKLSPQAAYWIKEEEA